MTSYLLKKVIRRSYYKRGVILKLTKFRESIFFRLVFTFLIIIIPIYLLGIYIYKWSLYNVKNEISKANIAQVSFYIEGLEKDIERIKILQYDCLNDENLNKLSSRYRIMNQYDINESMRQLQQRLVTIKNSSNYIKNVSVHILPIKKTISSNDGVDNFNDESFYNIRTVSGARGAEIIRYNEGLYLSTFQQENTSKQTPNNLINIELNKQSFIDALRKFKIYDESGSFLIGLDDGKIIINESEKDKKLIKNEIVDNLSRKGPKGMNYFEIDNKGYYVLHVKSNYLNMIFLKYIPKDVLEIPINSFYIWGWVFSVAIFCIILIYCLYTYRLIHKPLLKLVKSFNKVENGDLQISIKHDLNDEFGYLYKCFNKMMKNLNTLIDQVYNQKILMQRAELKQLQSQINPHFLYNSFFAINTMAKTGDENLIAFTKHLGEYFRFITRNSSDQIILQEEINHAQVYTEIQLMRFSSSLQIEFNKCPEKYLELKVPRLILQPVIENSINHGLKKGKSFGIIYINFDETENGLDIIVEDNGCGMTDSEMMKLELAMNNLENNIETTAIINIHRRIRLVYGQNSGVLISKSELGGLKVTLRIEIPI